MRMSSQDLCIAFTNIDLVAGAWRCTRCSRRHHCRRRCRSAGRKRTTVNLSIASKRQSQDRKSKGEMHLVFRFDKGIDLCRTLPVRGVGCVCERPVLHADERVLYSVYNGVHYEKLRRSMECVSRMRANGKCACRKE